MRDEKLSKKMTKENLENIIDLISNIIVDYESGFGIKSISEKHNLAIGTVWKILKDNNVETRKQNNKISK